MIRILRACLLLAGWLVFAGAASADQTFVDAAGRTVAIPDHVERVMAAGPPAQVFLYVLAPDKLVGWVKEPSAADKALLLPSVASLPVQGRLTAKDGAVNADAIKALKPDVIVDIGDVSPRYAEVADKVQQATGIPYVLLDGHFAKTAESLRTAGKLLHVEGRGEQLAAYATEIEARARIASMQHADARPSVYYGRGPDGLETGKAGSINMEILEGAGAENVVAALGDGGITQVTPEQIAQWKPGVILAETDAFFAKLKQDPAFAGIPAVQNFNIYHFPTSPFGWVDSPPSVNRLLGMQWLLAVLYPDPGKGARLAAATKEFYSLFYGVDLTDAQVQDFVKTAAPAK